MLGLEPLSERKKTLSGVPCVIASGAVVTLGAERRTSGAIECVTIQRPARAPGGQVLGAAVEAILGGLPDEMVPPPDRRAIVVGTASGARSEIDALLEETERVGPALFNPGLFPYTVVNAAAGMAAIRGDCRGPNITLHHGVRSFLDALGCAARLLHDDRADLVFSGGYELGEVGHGGVVAVVLALVRRCSGRRPCVFEWTSVTNDGVPPDVVASHAVEHLGAARGLESSAVVRFAQDAASGLEALAWTVEETGRGRPVLVALSDVDRSTVLLVDPSGPRT